MPSLTFIREDGLKQGSLCSLQALVEDLIQASVVFSGLGSEVRACNSLKALSLLFRSNLSSFAEVHMNRLR